jgi:NAD+ kinase
MAELTGRRVQRVALVLKRGAGEALATATELRQELVSRGVEVYGEANEWAEQCGAVPRPASEFASGLDLVLVLGGDGTFIQAARLVGSSGVPLLGVNLGSLGFLTQFSTREVRALLDWALAGDYKVEERLRLDVSLRRGGKVIFTDTVLNDVVINQGSLASLVDLEARLDGLPVTSYKADGLIMATPTGSTAYALAAGGPIVSPGLDAVVMAPICSHTLTVRPVVVPATSVIELTLRSERGQVYLTLDGKTGQPLSKGDEVRVSLAPSRLRTVQSPLTDYFSLLRSKLHWGAREGRDPI